MFAVRYFVYRITLEGSLSLPAAGTAPSGGDQTAG